MELMSGAQRNNLYAKRITDNVLQKKPGILDQPMPHFLDQLAPRNRVGSCKLLLRLGQHSAKSNKNGISHDKGF